MSILISMVLLQASAAPADAARPAAAPASLPSTARQSKICREMLLSSSRLGAVKVCKTRAAWQRWERCNSATRYCAPPRQNTVTVASLPGDKLVCKYLKETGSRLDQQKICATSRQWELVELETQETVRDRQNQTNWPEGIPK